jgi:hypothetical protein
VELLILFFVYIGISVFFHQKIQKAKTSLSMFGFILIYCVATLVYAGLSLQFGGWTMGPCGDPSPFLLAFLCFVTGGANIIAAAWRRKW